VREKFLNRKQVRYLGIVIEKDDEYALNMVDIKRVYIPTKGKYMEVVKSARMIHVDCLERNKGLAEIPRTMRRLSKKSKDIRLVINHSNKLY